LSFTLHLLPDRPQFFLSYHLCVPRLVISPPSLLPETPSIELHPTYTEKHCLSICSLPTKHWLPGGGRELYVVELSLPLSITLAIWAGRDHRTTNVTTLVGWRAFYLASVGAPVLLLSRLTTPYYHRMHGPHPMEECAITHHWRCLRFYTFGSMLPNVHGTNVD
jgi:hypothetical protein